MVNYSLLTKGFLIIENFMSDEEIMELKAAASEIVRDLDITAHPLTKFTTDENNHIKDEYFIESGDKQRCFFEERAFDKNGVLQCDKSVSVNKIGHGLHIVNPVFRNFTMQCKIQQIIDDVGLKCSVILQSMYIFKVIPFLLIESFYWRCCSTSSRFYIYLH